MVVESADPNRVQTYLRPIVGDNRLTRRDKVFVPLDVTGKKKDLPKDESDPFGDLDDWSLDLRVQTVTEKPESEGGRAEGQKPVQVEQYSVLEGLLPYAPERVLLVGKPGSGKTTALGQVLRVCARIGLGEMDPIPGFSDTLRQKIPVLLRLRDLRTTAHTLLKDSMGSFGLILEDIELESLLKQGSLLLLLDGVNEIRNPELREDLRLFLGRFRANPVIATTRDLNRAVDLGIEKKLTLQSLTSTQMQQFVSKHLDAERGKQFLDRLDNRLKEFAETPLLL